jgi:nucleotide exchange factor SIL1
MASYRSRSFVRVALSLIFLSFFIACVAASSPPAAAASSPSAETELICHTENPAECYPKIFSATEEFQIVHDDQDLPSGLHVRLDMGTGKKEARLNTPMADDPALEGLPVEQAVLVVDQHGAEEELPLLRPGAPIYEPVGVVKEPLDKNPNFAAALGFLKSHAEKAPSDTGHPLDDALNDLEDVSHDMYYGQKISEDAEALQALFCLLTQRDLEQVKSRGENSRRDFLASTILVSSIQNNRPALTNVENHWDSVLNKQCAFHQKPLRDIIYKNLEPKSQPGTEDWGHEATWTHSELRVMGRLLKSDVIGPQFLDNDGMKHFLQVLLTKGPEWETARGRVSQYVSDTFLDEDMGARLELWPFQAAASDKSVCEQESTRLDGGCWDYHLEALVKEKVNSAWAEDLLTMLKQKRPGMSGTKDEL